MCAVQLNQNSAQTPCVHGCVLFCVYKNTTPQSYLSQLCLCQLAFEGSPLLPPAAVTPTAAPCAARDLSRWDKLFIMLEDSHMRQNMLMQHVDDMVRVELQYLRDEMRRLSADNRRACATALEGTCAGLGEQMSRGFQHTQRQLREAEEKCQTQHNATRHLLQDTQKAQAARLAKLESGYGHGASLGQAPMKTRPTHPKEQDATSAGGTKMERTLLAVASDLQRVQAQLAVFQRSSASRYIPSGRCKMKEEFHTTYYRSDHRNCSCLKL